MTWAAVRDGLGQGLPVAAVFALVWLCYRLDVRRRERDARLEERRRRVAWERYQRWEFDVNPPVFDFEQEEAA